MATRNDDSDSWTTPPQEREEYGKQRDLRNPSRSIDNRLRTRSNSPIKSHKRQKNLFPPLDNSRASTSLTNNSSTNVNIQEISLSPCPQKTSIPSLIPVPVFGSPPSRRRLNSHNRTAGIYGWLNSQDEVHLSLPSARGRRDTSANSYAHGSSGYGSAVSRTRSGQHSAKIPFIGGNVRFVDALCHKKKFYKMNHGRRGYFLIFNFNSPDIPRNGSDIDVEALQRCFTSLRFEVKICHNYTTEGIKRELQKYSKFDHSDCDCFGIAILSHGGQGYINTKNGKLSLDAIIREVKTCRSLLGKPKLIFVQCCRTTEIESDAKVVRRSPAFSFEADLLISYATTKGNLAFRMPTEGSPYVQKLTEILMDKGEQENLLDLLTEVNATVKEKADGYGVCQVTAMESTLSKSLKFDKVVKSYRCIQFSDGRMEYEIED